MPLSKKYYQMIADVLKDIKDEYEPNADMDESIVYEVAKRLGDQLKSDNIRFDHDRWYKWIFNQFPHIRKDQ
tara:strand:+ start:382 stop:597 length:216 start_codon:yes stop_codon:yes gene_type:complete